MAPRGIMKLAGAATAAVSVAALTVPMATSAQAGMGAESGALDPKICQVGSQAGMTASFTSPSSGTSIDLARTPRFDLTGQVASTNAAVRQISLFADGKYIGDPQLTRRSGVVDWQLPTTAPAGAHVLTVCGYSVAGSVTGARLDLDVKAPAPDAIVFAPGVLNLGTDDVKDIVSATSSSVTFKGKKTFAVGNVLVAPGSAGAPEGLMRRVTGVSVKGTTTVVSTNEAPITDVVWQATIERGGIPLADPATANPSASVSATLALAADAPTATWRYANSFTGGGGVGPVATGNVALDLTFTTRVRIGVKATFVWAESPRITLTDFLLSETGRGKMVADVTLSKAGTVSYKRNLVSQVLAPVPVWAAPPIVLTPSVALDLSVTGSSRAAVKWVGRSDVELVVGTEYKDGAWVPIRTGSVTGSLSTPFDPNPADDNASNTNDLNVTLTPRVDLKVNGIIGPVLTFPVGLDAKASYPCPGTASADLFLKATVGISAGFLDQNVADLSTTVMDQRRNVYSGVAPGCFKLTTTSLPSGRTGKAYSTTLQATAGAPSYTWAATALPAGLTLDPATGTISGTPTKIGVSEVAISATDGLGQRVRTTLRLTVTP